MGVPPHPNPVPKTYGLTIIIDKNDVKRALS